jgi:predicted outer membrane repeat protein
LVVSNHSTTTGGGINAGAGINSVLGALTIDHSTITNNQADQSGGGIHAVGEPFTIAITNSTISNNIAAQTGGGINLQIDGSQITLANSNIIGNSAQSGGGVFNGVGFPNDSLSISDVVFAGNHATQDSGGLYLSGGTTITRAVFAQNSAGTTGGGLSSYIGFHGSQLRSVSGVFVIQNTAGDHGGGVFNGVEANNALGGVVFADNQPDNCYQPAPASGCP